MDVMTPGEAMDAQIAVVKEHLATLLSNIPLAHWLDEPNAAQVEQDFIDQARDFILQNMTEALVVRAIVMSVWEEANERARTTLTNMKAFTGDADA